MNWLLFKNRVGVYGFCLCPRAGICVVYKKFSQPENLFVIEAESKTLAENFLDAAAEIDDLTPMDVMAIAIHLNITINPEVAYNLLSSDALIRALAEQLSA
ncbi:hypothetical protein KKE19_02930 [Patescibacteria group bacterium]|nr:hypothetical protein [Patescibacteria group bacterium]MBU4367811.1 hypothetical protein [Patescibacteria group bacterium]MBU4461521.1 hypothetical protein [Patescibacteria group bacterium]MCG2700338.1 hypothetical protein [Candidatus Parcubacteria bacterium]